ncbi:MAG: hypothetical protein ACUVYA_03435, partial [Planctomycetota bacterium]
PPNVEKPLPSREGAALARRPARAFEAKKRPLRLLREEERSPLARFFTGGLELDPGVDLERLARFADDFQAFVRELGVSAEWGSAVELKFRRLGRHRADGLYYPVERVLVLDLKTWSSFAHEFAHLMDYSAQAIGPYRRTLSGGEGFAPIRARLLERMRERAGGDPRLAHRSGRLSWGYFASAPECFARTFEQFAAEALGRPTALVHDASRYRSDPLFFPELPQEAFAYFARTLAEGPRARSALFGGELPESASLSSASRTRRGSPRSGASASLRSRSRRTGGARR